MESFKDKIPNFIEEDRQVYNPKTSCISGRENVPADAKKLVQQFRYNRVRLVPQDRPTEGRLPVINFIIFQILYNY